MLVSWMLKCVFVLSSRKPVIKVCGKSQQTLGPSLRLLLLSIRSTCSDTSWKEKFRCKIWCQVIFLTLFQLSSMQENSTLIQNMFSSIERLLDGDIFIKTSFKNASKPPSKSHLCGVFYQDLKAYMKYAQSTWQIREGDELTFQIAKCNQAND